MSSTVTCPDCARPAALLGRFVLPGANGPVEYLRIRCAGSPALLVAAREVDRRAEVRGAGS